MQGDITLPVNFGIIKQDTYYWCGPATTQMILSARGILLSESDLARSLGTTVDGTNSIRQLTAVLNDKLPDAKFIVREIADPASRQAKDLWWSDVKWSIDGGYGVGANIIAPQSNPPKPTRGEFLSYSGFPVYHYLAIMGYNEARREVLVADSGFRDYLYWASADQMATVVAGKGYTSATAVPADGVDAPAVIDFIKAFVGPVISDVKDVREQFCGQGSRDAGQYRGWRQLGQTATGANRTLVDGLADFRDHVAAVR